MKILSYRSSQEVSKTTTVHRQEWSWHIAAARQTVIGHVIEGSKEVGGMWKITLKGKVTDFPGGPVVKNLPSNAGDTGSIPGQGTRISHAMGKQRLCATATEPTCPNLRSHMLYRKIPHAATKTQFIQKQRRKEKKRKVRFVLQELKQNKF